MFTSGQTHFMNFSKTRLLSILCWVLLLLTFTVSVSATTAVCERESSAQLHGVKRVIDADTLELSNGQRVRLIGVDAPELGRRGAPDEPFAREGKRALEHKINQTGGQIWVQPGEDPYDRYNRLLADLFFANGQSIQGWLLEQGWVMQVFVAPNLRYADCLKPLETQARAAQLNIWSLPEYQQGIESTRIPSTIQGTVIVKGKVQRIGRSQANLWLNLEGGVAVQIPRDQLDRFDARLDQLEGKVVRVRGWIIRENSRHHQWRIRLDDGRALEVL